MVFCDSQTVAPPAYERIGDRSGSAFSMLSPRFCVIANHTWFEDHALHDGTMLYEPSWMTMLLMVIGVGQSMYHITVLFLVMLILHPSDGLSMIVFSHCSFPSGVMTQRAGKFLFSSNNAVLTAIVFGEDEMIVLAVLLFESVHRSVPSSVR